MPAAAKNGSALFLGLELATDQLRASIVDESLELIGVECVDFDTDLPEYQTHGGIFTTPGDAYTTPVDMWIKGLDFLFEKIQRNYDLSRIKSIGGAAQHALVWWKSSPIASYPALDHRLPLHSQLPPHTFSLPNTPIASDTSAHTHALALESLLGGPDHMAARVGTCAHASLTAAQLLRMRESDVWGRTGRIQLASSFIASIVCGKWVPIGEAEACASGMWHHVPNGNGVGNWDDAVLDIVGGSREEGRRVRGWLGEVDVANGGKRIGTVSKYLVERYQFDPDTIVTPFTSDYLSTYLSLCPSTSDAVLSFGPMDALLTPVQTYIPTRLYSLYPHPAQDAGEKKRYIAMLASRNADVPRALVRDMYTKSWSAFDRLVAIVPPGGSIGLDDKLFSFWLLQGDSFPFSHVKGIFRFETGIKVNEFRDLRANPRTLLESQVLSFRVRWSRMISTGLLGNNNRGRGNIAQPTPQQTQTLAQQQRSSLGLSFDPYDYTPLPSRILVTGAAANFPAVANLVGDVFNAPVFMPSTQVDSAQVVPHRNAPASGFPGRASLGGAYVARWVWGRERGTGAAGGGRLGGFEEEMRRLLGKRWVATGGLPLRTNTNGPTGGGGGSGANSGASTPYGHPNTRSGLGSTVFVEEDEDELEEMERSGSGYIGNIIPGFGEMDLGPTARVRTITGSTVDTVTSGGGGTSTAFTTPELGGGSGGASPGAGTNGAANPSAPTPLTPVSALATADAEAQIGLSKVAEPDVDAFMTYAAIVPEYCRLEGMLVKSLV
ncbi:hypothetical protein PLICRDRAFT_57417 [Plicaturopsis crispa FD-325 SS-3]|uniref:Unplaced genomic scaffold PLICRscaffold_16, whole genome shotgun sequence n=1 Tax=Plicaturopsis crispa FD-325 SS-3 TaxID=944288 RepID=A0A0C9SL58_PLICR|nr:hypothetical protein PLICRDRAFT_57417 [Plicaturopsis crispa FD-325 SS-3]